MSRASFKNGSWSAFFSKSFLFAGKHCNASSIYRNTRRRLPPAQEANTCHIHATSPSVVHGARSSGRVSGYRRVHMFTPGRYHLGFSWVLEVLCGLEKPGFRINDTVFRKASDCERPSTPSRALAALADYTSRSVLRLFLSGLSSSWGCREPPLWCRSSP